MAEKWQLWMPFYIDRFKASPAVRAMHPTARSAYLYLLAYAWQTDDCTIPSDPYELAEISEIGDELWAIHGPRVLRNFAILEDGKMRNLPCFALWEEAKHVFASGCEKWQNIKTKRSEAGKKGALLRWASKTEWQTDGKPMANDSLTGTGTVKTKNPPTPQRATPTSAGANGEFMAATWLGEELSLAWSRNDLPLIANVIRLEAKARGEPAEQAVQFLRTSALEARGRGEAVTVWWFKDRKFAHTSGNGKAATPTAAWTDEAVKKRADAQDAEEIKSAAMWLDMSEKYRAANPWEGAAEALLRARECPPCYDESATAGGLRA